jgi:hypothetical protein
MNAAELARHVASCPQCTRQAEAAQRFERIWEASRPAEPGPDAWKRIWAEVTRANGPIVLAMPPQRQRRRWLIPVLGLTIMAQAAAVLVAVGLLFTRSGFGTGPNRVVSGHTPVHTQAVVEFNLDTGQTLILKLEGGDRIVCSPQFIATDDLMPFDPEGALIDSSPFDVVVLNNFEGMAQ